MEIKPGQTLNLDINLLNDGIPCGYNGLVGPILWTNNASNVLSVSPVFVISLDTLNYTVTIPSNTDFGTFAISATNTNMLATFEIMVVPVAPCVKTLQIVASTPQ